MTPDLEDHDLRAEQRLLDTALAERSGRAPVPDLTDAIRARLLADESTAPRHGGLWLTAAALLLGGLATLAIALGARQDREHAARQDPVAEPIEYLPFDPTDPEARIPEDATAVAILCINPDEAKQVSLAALANHATLRHARVDVTYILGPLRAELVDPPAGWLAPLASCRKLESLELRTVRPSLTELRAFGDHPALAALTLHHPAPWTAADTAVLARIPGLVRLSLEGVACPQDDPGGLASLGDLAELRELQLHRLGGFDAGEQSRLADVFPRLTRLHRLTLGADTLPASGIFPLRHIDFVQPDLYSEFLSRLSELPALEELALVGSATLPKDALGFLPAGLRHLTLAANLHTPLLQRPEQCAATLAKWTDLEGLTLLPAADPLWKADADALAAVLRVRPFRHLHLPAPLGGAVVAVLNDQIALESLTLSTGAPPDDPTEALDLSFVAHLPRLATLRLQADETRLRSWLTASDLAPLTKAPRLRRLLVTSSTPELLRGTRAALPELLQVEPVEWRADR